MSISTVISWQDAIDRMLAEGFRVSQISESSAIVTADGMSKADWIMLSLLPNNQLSASRYSGRDLDLNETTPFDDSFIDWLYASII